MGRFNKNEIATLLRFQSSMEILFLCDCQHFFGDVRVKSKVFMFALELWQTLHKIFEIVDSLCFVTFLYTCVLEQLLINVKKQTLTL